MSAEPRWLGGEPELCRALGSAWLDAEGAGAELVVLRERPGRRRLLRVTLADGTALFVKHYRGAGPRRAAARALRQEAARREWRNHLALSRAGVAVASPRALAALPGGERLLALDHHEGRTLGDALAAVGPRERRGLLASVATCVADLHAAGFAHGDLHTGNVLLTAHGPLLVDLQLAHTPGSAGARTRDLGELDRWLLEHLGLAERVRLRADALGLARPFDAAARRRLRAVGAASLARLHAHALSRSRRALRPGRRFARARSRGAQGLRARELDPDVLDAALDGRPPSDTRVERWAAPWPRALLQRWQGSPARRAWLAAHRRHALGVPAPVPLAWLERRRLGAPTESLLVSRSPAGAPPASPCALADYAMRLRACGEPDPLGRLEELGADAASLRRAGALDALFSREPRR